MYDLKKAHENRQEKTWIVACRSFLFLDAILRFRFGVGLHPQTQRVKPILTATVVWTIKLTVRTHVTGVALTLVVMKWETWIFPVLFWTMTTNTSATLPPAPAKVPQPPAAALRTGTNLRSMRLASMNEVPTDNVRVNEVARRNVL